MVMCQYCSEDLAFTGLRSRLNDQKRPKHTQASLTNEAFANFFLWVWILYQIGIALYCEIWCLTILLLFLIIGFVQRRSHRVLRQSLPAKYEHVLLVRMSPLQRKLYATFTEDLLAQRSMANPLKAFAVCCKIWNHPDVLCKFLSKFFYEYGFVISILVWKLWSKSLWYKLSLCEIF